MTIELNIVSYILLGSILSAASIIAIRSGKHPDAHPFVMNTQGEFTPLRYPGETAIVKSKANSAGALTTLLHDDRAIKTLSELYQLSLLKFKSNQFLGTRLHNQSVAWSQYGILSHIKTIE